MDLCIIIFKSMDAVTIRDVVCVTYANDTINIKSCVRKEPYQYNLADIALVSIN